jgi:hypothetical protein
MAVRCQLCWLVEIFNLLFPETILKGCSIIHYPICSLCWSEMVATEGQCSIIELYTIGTYIIDYGAEQKRFIQVFSWRIRDRPFNLQGRGYGFLFHSEMFFRISRVRIFFFGRAKREFFFQSLTLGYMTKTLNQIIFFSSTKIRIFFLEKNHNPFKLNGRSLISFNEMKIIF